MKILIVSPFLPYPANWGFAKRVFHLLEVLARRHELTLLTYSDRDNPDHVQALRKYAAVQVVQAALSPVGKRLAQLASVASASSFQRRMMFSEPMQRAIDDVTRRERFDVIQIETSQMACFRFERDALLLLDEHNVEYELYYRVFRAEGSPARRLFNWLEYVKFKREEIAAWRGMSGCLVTSDREAAVIRATVPSTPVTVVPNAVDTDFFSPADTPVDPDAIVLTGLMKYRPNVDGAIFFVREILPRVLAKRPNAVFYIVGGEAPPEVTRLASRHVVVTGSVEDVRPYVHRAAVFVVPLRMGSGTRLKVLEGLAMAKPMVSTALGCEGIELTHGKHLLIANEAETFAEAVLTLMSDAPRAQQLAAQGRALMLERYRWEVAVEALEQFYERLSSAPTAGRGAPRLVAS